MSSHYQPDISSIRLLHIQEKEESPRLLLFGKKERNRYIFLGFEKKNILYLKCVTVKRI